MSNVHVVALLRARVGHEGAVREMLEAIVEAARQEAGCLRYSLTQSETDPAEFVFIEEWASHAALDAHLAGPVVQDCLVELMPLLLAPPDIRRYRLLV